MHDTVIREFENHKDWIQGSVMARRLHDEYGHTESNFERTFRELTGGFDRGGQWCGKYLERELRQIEGKGPKLAYFKIREEPVIEFEPFQVQEVLF